MWKNVSLDRPPGHVGELAASPSRTQIIANAPSRSQIVFPMNLGRAVEESGAQRFDIHPHRSRVREEPFFHAAWRPCPVVDRPFEILAWSCSEGNRACDPGTPAERTKAPGHQVILARGGQSNQGMSRMG